VGKPDPECKWCHGTGEIRLVVTTVPCDCTKDCKGCGDDECKKGCGDQGDCIKLADEDEDEDTGACGGGCGGCYHV